MKKLFLVLCLSATAAFGAGFVESKSDPNIEPGRDTTVDFNKLYPLVGLPSQVALHPKTLAGLIELQKLGEKAVTQAKADATVDVTPAVLSAQTWTRPIPKGEQKFWVFQAIFKKGPKGQPGTEVVAGHFIAGAYTLYDGKQTFPLQSRPPEPFAFLGTFPAKEGPFAMPAPQPTP